MYFDLHMTPEVIICLSIAFMAMLLLVSVYRRRVSIVRRHRDARTGQPEPQGEMPGVSVVIYSRENNPGLGKLLPMLLTQTYDGAYEVIVVADGDREQTRDMVTQLAVGHRNIRLTFVPDEAHNLSRRKLGITLGVKAARQPYIILTTSDVRIDSELWLARMARNFADGYDIVLGHAVLDRTHDRGIGGTARAFDRAVEAVTYLGSAICGKTYRGSGYNIGFRRQLFFDCKGFAGSLNLHAGDDDIFVSRIAAEGVTAVELDDEAHVTVDLYNPRREHRASRASHLFTGRRVRKGARRFMTLGSWLMWIWLGASVLAITAALPNLIPACAMVVTGAVIWMTLSMAWSKTLQALGERAADARIAPLLLLVRPLTTLSHKLRAIRHRQRFYTWYHN